MPVLFSKGDNKMKNKKIYDKYAINGWPCHFYTIEATDKYNERIEKYCNKLPEGSSDLSILQKIKRYLYIVCLDVYDVIFVAIKK